MTAVHRLAANRQVGMLAAAAALLVYAPDAPLRDDALSRPVVATEAPPPVVVGMAMPSIVATTAAGGAAYAYAQQALIMGSAIHFERSAFQTIEEAWSAAFFGDKQRMSEFIEHAAVINGLPVEFLMRLLRQESGLNHRAVSRAGAQGVAQFMPGTASARGLVDPFNPFEAIPKSAELLKEYRTRFGNLGFAAAAYNAGPQRVRDWLSGRSLLPKETRDYVAKITGRTTDDWRQSGDIYATAEPWLDSLRK
ncbi:soluble lytic murein transglycosylase-like protein [Methylobacterium sp. BE186]|uniref:lytic transglycosylase domain-containing protein n=1 Tax=Methylobacterium sp. BE186 TaxID=2817715 RepID=UPI0028657BBF|nr:lytic transglycosylase domain-containing protein [Methylobacterium sp. BE186]MDR7038826.1 soluble lytic murein transglycosylase-like protein [Methylobacterium sp. BE186]